MTCDQSIELLPWLLNGTLEAEERAEVRRHLATCDRCREALAETQLAGALFSQHIPGPDLVSLAWGERPSGIDPALAESHLASCPQCAAELELVRMSRRLEEEDNVAVFPAAKPRPGVVEAPRTWRAWAVAASLLAVVASSGWVYTAVQATDPAAGTTARAEAPAPAAPQAPGGEASSLKQKIARMEDDMNRLMGLQQENEKKLGDAQAQVAQLEKEREILARPQATAMVDLGSGDVVRSGEAAAEKTPRVQEDRYATLFLPARDEAEHRAEVVNGSGKVVWQASRLPVTEGTYALSLPPHSLPPGLYTLKISGRDERWTFQVVP
jgi:predicted anti-sigma-YlaC factor YlaD